MTAAATILTLGEVSMGEVPRPRVYVAAFAVYLALSFVADVGGPGGAKFATTFGGLTLVGIALSRLEVWPKVVQALGGASAPLPEVTETEAEGA
jgi:hypothetical protein